ncbi:MAG TPA: hypothetical protein VL914_11150 [Vicinamibacterales bacterium]|jgi:hypothetical protein|nr:hypothetical protein [Vicinamibacterales bacterium]
MVIDNVFGINRKQHDDHTGTSVLARGVLAISRQVARFWCGMHGHVIMLHFEPNKLSLQCSLCAYETEGWEVGRSMTARRQANNPQARPERRRTLRPLPTNARLAS